MNNWYDLSKKLEWKLARHEGSEQERSIWYHGTKASNLPSILSQGLIVDPSKRAWDKNEHTDAGFNSPSQASISGIYVTRNLLTARVAAQHNLPRGEDRVLVIMELQPRSLVADEDMLTHYVKSVLNSASFGSREWDIAVIFMANELGTNRGYVQNIKSQYATTGVNLMEKYYGPFHPQLKNRISEILIGMWGIVLNRQASHVDEYTWDRAFYNNISPSMRDIMCKKKDQINKLDIPEEKKDMLYHKFAVNLIPKRPDINIFENRYLAFMDQLTRTIKDAARPLKTPQKASQLTARSIENIGFKGSNKIVGIVKIDNDMKVTLVYGTMPDDFLKQWEETTGPIEIK